jgi:F-type H+-transporting ATPase subunit O
LFSAASKQSTLDQVEQELKQLKEMLSGDAKVKMFLETPTIDREKKSRGIDIILGQKKHAQTTVNFFKLLAENGRLAETVPIINSFNSLMVAHRGEVNVIITSAKVFWF